MTDKKISDEELREQLENGDKTEKEIAYDHGYGYPSNALNQRIHDLGFRKNQKINVKDNNAGQFYLGSETMQQAADQKNIDLNEAGKVFFQVNEIVDGEIVLEMTTDSFRRTQD
jgi:hypothetical protein